MRHFFSGTRSEEVSPCLEILLMTARGTFPGNEKHPARAAGRGGFETRVNIVVAPGSAAETSERFFTYKGRAKRREMLRPSRANAPATGAVDRTIINDAGCNYEEDRICSSRLRECHEKVKGSRLSPPCRNSSFPAVKVKRRLFLGSVGVGIGASDPRSC